ncbi:MAG: T9SS type A sorting domain-containing protein [Bacteroidetes bacterium]|jgi:hypothetical protein|nr:T9SS type A sorting domain-containing protein [Bacteroidota bacterium]
MATQVMAQADVQLTVPDDAIVQAALADVFGPEHAAKDARTKAGPLAHIDFNLTLLYHEYAAFEAAGKAGPFTSTNALARLRDGRVLVDASGDDGPALLRALEALGLTRGEQYRTVVSGYLPIDKIPDAARLGSLTTLRMSAFTRGVGATTTQADEAMESDEARSNFSVDGSGTKGCAMSDSYDALGGASGDVSTGDLPGAGNPLGNTTPVDVVQDDLSSGNVDEGRAMLQIIHDVAPGAALGFHTAFGGQAVFAQGITDLVNAGCGMIVDDILYFAEPAFQDGVIAQAADAAFSSGVSYFSSAGNSAQQSYHDAYADSGVNISGYGRGTVPTHGFDGGGDWVQQITIPEGTSVIFTLQWDDPFASTCSGCPGPDTDLDFLLLDDPPTTVLAGAATDNIAGGDAVEVFQYDNPSGSGTTFNLAIGKFTGPDPGRLQYFYTSSAVSIDEYATDSPTSYGHANAAGAEAVGASAWFNTPAFGVSPPVINGFSSVGGVPILFDTNGNRLGSPETRLKPGITGPDGGNNTFFGSDSGADADAFPNFFGTSASAPACGALALLYYELLGNPGPQTIYDNMRASAIDMDNPYTGGFDTGHDFATGFGLCNAPALLPVELTAFDAVADGEAVTLRWETASETNNAGFEVQRLSMREPENGSEGDEGAWQALGFVEGHGTTAEPQRYVYQVGDLAPGTHTFRLRQVDFDGTFEYSPEVEVAVEMAAAYRLTPAHPNPFNPTTQFSVAVQRAQHVRIDVYDVTGRRVRTLFDGRLAAQQTRTVVFDGDALPSGVYYLRARGQTFSATEAVVRTQ